MNISNLTNTYSPIYSSNKTHNIQVSHPKALTTDTVCFKGRSQCEKIAQGGFKYLIQETSLFREPSTLEYVTNYIHNNFHDKPNKNIVVGACATGEDLYSIKMLMDSVGEKANFIGFDLGKKAIQSAQSYKIVMGNPKDKNFHKENHLIQAYKDSFLAYDSNRHLNKVEKKYKKLFDENFKKTNQNDSSFKGTLFGLKMAITGGEPKEINYKEFKLNPEKRDNCKFVQGNILELDKTVPENSADALFFRNALYHLLTTTEDSKRTTLPCKKARKVMKKITEQVHKALKKDGLLVFGEREYAQKTNWYIVSDVLKKNGFKPVFGVEKQVASVWKKVD